MRSRQGQHTRSPRLIAVVNFAEETRSAAVGRAAPVLSAAAVYSISRHQERRSLRFGGKTT
jgi:hypothetical protein